MLSAGLRATEVDVRDAALQNPQGDAAEVDARRWTDNAGLRKRFEFLREHLTGEHRAIADRVLGLRLPAARETGARLDWTKFPSSPGVRLSEHILPEGEKESQEDTDDSDAEDERGRTAHKLFAGLLGSDVDVEREAKSRWMPSSQPTQENTVEDHGQGEPVLADITRDPGPFLEGDDGVSVKKLPALPLTPTSSPPPRPNANKPSPTNDIVGIPPDTFLDALIQSLPSWRELPRSSIEDFSSGRSSSPCVISPQPARHHLAAVRVDMLPPHSQGMHRGLPQAPSGPSVRQTLCDARRLERSGGTVLPARGEEAAAPFIDLTSYVRQHTPASTGLLPTARKRVGRPAVAATDSDLISEANFTKRRREEDHTAPLAKRTRVTAGADDEAQNLQAPPASILSSFSPSRPSVIIPMSTVGAVVEQPGTFGPAPRPVRRASESHYSIASSSISCTVGSEKHRRKKTRPMDALVSKLRRSLEFVTGGRAEGSLMAPPLDKRALDGDVAVHDGEVIGRAVRPAGRTPISTSSTVRHGLSCLESQTQ